MSDQGTKSLPGAYRAARITRPALATVQLKDVCFEHLDGCKKHLAHENQCTKGVHGIQLIREAEAKAYGRSAAPKFTNTLTSAPRKVGIGQKAEDFHKDLPGCLSADGPRHDNDIIEERDIRIFPTTDEILAKRLPHLPKKESALLLPWGGGPEKCKKLAGVLFRHHRYDATEPIIDAIYRAMQHLVTYTKSGRQTPGVSIANPFQYETPKGTPFAMFYNVDFEGFTSDEHAGLEVRLSYSCPRMLRGEAMRDSGLFEDGMLCALVGVNVETKEVHNIFLESKIRQSTFSMKHKTGDDSRAALVCHMADREDIIKARELTYLSRFGGKKMRYAIVDMPKFLIAGFVPILRRLRMLSAAGGPHLSESITSLSGDATQLLPPCYARAESFQWRLDSLKNDDKDEEPFVLKINHREAAIKEMTSRTTLDLGQAQALFDNLNREVAFTQGPPGTGKSYLGAATVKVILDSYMEDGRGPILVVAQTNHAVDDILQDLIVKGVEKVIRLGNGCRSPKLLDGHMLKSAVKKRNCTGKERYDVRLGKDQVEHLWIQSRGWAEAVDIGDDVMAKFASINLTEVMHKVADKCTASLNSEADCDSDSEPSISAKYDEMQTRPESKEKIAFRSLRDSLSPEERCDAFVESHRRLQEARKRLNNAQRMVKLAILKEQNVVGMTATAVAQEWELLQQLKPRVLVIEEASELTESHTLCATLPSIEHAICIGDPKQLRPHISLPVLKLEKSKAFRFDESLFERLMQCGFPFAKLNVQRRAHPELATLIRVTDYPYVSSHESCLMRPFVRGMQSRMQWLNHTRPEKALSGSSTLDKGYANKYESRYVAQLVEKLVVFHQYRPGDITVLTPYNGQLADIAGHLSKRSVKVRIPHADRENLLTKGYLSRKTLDLISEQDPTDEFMSITLDEMVTVASIDNYQGEEARLVIFSAVRSNDEGKIGFVAIENRINVAISRAKEGFFVLGNAACLRKKSDFWNRVVGVFEKNGRIDNGFHLSCPFHPDVHRVVKDVYQRQESPDDSPRLAYDSLDEVDLTEVPYKELCMVCIEERKKGSKR